MHPYRGTNTGGGGTASYRDFGVTAPIETPLVGETGGNPRISKRVMLIAALGALAATIAATHEVACLETERVTFYERLGWERWRGPMAGRAERGLVATPDQQGVLILRLPRTPDLDLDRLLTIECQASRIW